MNKNDLRYVKTEMAIKNSFFELINEVGFDQTSVTNICERSLISRNTFYTHYQSKEDLLDAIYIDVEYLFMDKLNNLNNIKEQTIIYVNIVNENKDMFFSLLKCPTIGFKKVLLETVILKPSGEFYKKKLEYKKLPIRMKLTLSYLVDAMISFTTEWLAHYNEISIDEVVEELFTLCSFPARHNYEMLSKLIEVPQMCSPD